MFDLLSLFKKNVNDVKNCSSVINCTEEARVLIEKWMKINGIEGVSFDEYIKQLGLDYIDIINLEFINLNLSNPIWKNRDFIGALCFKYDGVYTGYDSKFELDGKNGAFISKLRRLDKSMDITNTIFLFKNGLGARLNIFTRRNGTRFKHSIQKDFNLDGSKNLFELKDTVSFSSDELYYDEPRYRYTNTIENGKSSIRVDNIRENTAFNVYINGNIIDFDDKEVRGKLWFSDDTYLKTVLDSILEYSDFEDEFSIKIEAIPGFDNIIYTRDKEGNIIIKEQCKKRKVYFSFENVHNENMYTKRFTVVCDKKRVNLDVVSTSDIEIKNLEKLISYIYDQYDGIFNINECFNKISSISFKDPDDSLVHVVLTEEYNDRIMKSKVWSRKYQFDRDYTMDDSSIVLRK